MSKWIYLVLLGMLVGFIGALIHPAFVVLWIICIPILIGCLCHVQNQQTRFFGDVVQRHVEMFRNAGVALSYEKVVEGSGKSKRTIQWLQLLVVVPANATSLVNVTVPPGVLPGAHIIVATPDGRQVSVVVPANATTGSTFQISVPAPVQPVAAAPTPQVVVATPVAPVAPQSSATIPQQTIHSGGFNYANPGFTAPKQMHVLPGVPVDTTGDGIADSMGYDTTGDGKIDAVDTSGDGKINFTTGYSKAGVGTKMGAS